MGEARRLRIYLKLVEITSIPLTVLLLIYILSGYGMVSPSLRILGFNYAFSARLHTSPWLRLSIVVLTVLHGHSGLAVLARKKIRSITAWRLVETGLAVLTCIFLLTCAYAEISTFRGLRFGRG
ncbi:MAG: hypothetical protein NZ954_04245 [Thermofilaceae archaeon]|nr:hypothetical protein [Thermofilaceae archaeon]MCX8180047.1 hypothetical protein [Thermofilaceae archaeon]MDW8003210.1 hypothetical protein [Thermofilaceae archaeon]